MTLETKTQETKIDKIINELSLITTTEAKCPLLPEGWDLATDDNLRCLFSLEVGYHTYLKSKHTTYSRWSGVDLADKDNTHLFMTNMLSLEKIEGKNESELGRDALRQTLLQFRDNKNIWYAMLSLQLTPSGEKKSRNCSLVKVNGNKCDMDGSRLALLDGFDHFTITTCNKCVPCLRGPRRDPWNCIKPVWEISYAWLLPGTIEEVTNKLLGMLEARSDCI